MKNLPKLTLTQWIGMVLILCLGTVGLMGFPAGAQVAPSSAADETQTDEANGESAETEKSSGAESQKAETTGDNAEKAGKSKSEADSQSSPPQAPEAEKLFESARAKLRSRLYRANIVQKLNFPDRTLRAKGKILRGENYRMRLEFEIQVGGTTGELVQVCDGDKLWTQRRVNDVTRLTRQDVKEILTKAVPSRFPQNLVVAEMGLGGITSLLASMNRTMNFGKPQSVTVEGEELYRVNGEWNAAFNAKIKANAQLNERLPDYVPDGARVYFDRDDFPRRIQYLKSIPETDAMRPLVTLDFLDVEWLSEEDVKPSQFEYHPPERVYPEDVTKSYVEQLQQPAPPAAPKP